MATPGSMETQFTLQQMRVFPIIILIITQNSSIWTETPGLINYSLKINPEMKRKNVESFSRK